MKFAEGAKFKMKAILAYPNFDFPESKFRVVKNSKESSKMEFLGYSNNAPDSIESKVIFDMYDGNIIIEF